MQSKFRYRVIRISTVDNFQGVLLSSLLSAAMQKVGLDFWEILIEYVLLCPEHI